MSLSPSLGIDVMSVIAKWLFSSKEYAIGEAQCPVPVQTTDKIVGAVRQSEVSCLLLGELDTLRHAVIAAHDAYHRHYNILAVTG